MTERVLIASRKGLFSFRHRPDGWRLDDDPVFMGSPVTLAMRDPRDGALYAALNLGHFGPKLHRSRDEGRSWKEITMPALPKAQPPGEGPSVNQIWSLETDGSDQPGGIWAGTIPGGLFHTADGGESWTLNEVLWDLPERENWFGGGYDQPGIHTICVDPRDHHSLSVAVSTGGVWQSRDAGKSWALRTEGMRAAYMPPELAYGGVTQDVHRMAQCAGAPQSYWVQHHNGIFRSTDGLATWGEITPPNCSNFGFAVVVHPEQADTAWFVPAVKDEFRYPKDGKFVVTRTRDGGRSFEILDRGLPQEPSYDLVYRHGLDIDDSGDRLVMGSTTGGAWISENGGDEWTRLPARLPPINAVRFI